LSRTAGWTRRNGQTGRVDSVMMHSTRQPRRRRHIDRCRRRWPTWQRAVPDRSGRGFRTVAIFHREIRNARAERVRQKATVNAIRHGDGHGRPFHAVDRGGFSSVSRWKDGGPSGRTARGGGMFKRTSRSRAGSWCCCCCCCCFVTVSGGGSTVWIQLLHNYSLYA